MLKIVRDEDIGYYSKEINSMIKQLKHSFISYIDNEYQKESSLLSPTRSHYTHRSSFSSVSDSPSLSSPLITSPLGSSGLSVNEPSGVSEGGSIPTHKKNSKSDILPPLSSIESSMSSISSSSSSATDVSISRIKTELSSPLPQNQLKLDITYPALSAPQLESTPDGSDGYKDVPRIIRLLSRRLNALHAYHNQGIFRIPGPMEQINYYANRFSLVRLQFFFFTL